MSSTLVVRGIGELCTCDPRRAPSPGVVHHAAVVAEAGVISYAGPEADMPRIAPGSITDELDCGGAAVVPGFVDSHTHLVWLGERSGEYGERAAGASYEAIAGPLAHSFLTLNGALWSMAIEVQFYVFFPVLLRLHEKHGGVRFLALVGAATVGYRLIVALLPLPSQPIGGIELGSLLMYQMPGRVLEFALGMWLADLYLHNPNQWKVTFTWIWIPIMPVALWCRAAGPAFLADPMLGILYCAIAGFAVICLGVQTGGITSLLEQRAAAFGRASYSFFLIHLPVLEILVRYWPADNEHPYATFLRLSLVGFAFSAAAGALLYHTVELPLWDRYRAPAVEHPRPRSLTPVTVGVMAPTAAEQRS